MGLLNHVYLTNDVQKKIKWFDELRRLSERFFHVDSDEIIFGLTTNLLYIFDI